MLVGAFVSLVSVPMAAVLLVAMFTVHLPYGFTSIKLMAVTADGSQFGPPVTNAISCISPARLPSLWVARGHGRSTAF